MPADLFYPIGCEPHWKNRPIGGDSANDLSTDGRFENPSGIACHLARAQTRGARRIWQSGD